MRPFEIVGAGGIGCALGYALRTAGAEVRFIEANPQKVHAGQREGVSVDHRPALPAAFIPFSEWEPDPGSLVLLCTKCYDNATVLDRLPEGTRFIPVQNGFDPLLLARGHAWEGIASFVSECDPDRPHTRITRPGKLHLGPLGEGVPDAFRALAQFLRISRLFRVVEVTQILPYKYTKLMYNAAISPLAAAAGVDNASLLTDPLARQLFFALIQENYRILHAAGVTLGKIGPFHPRTVARILRRPWLSRLMARAFTPSLRGTYCSMAPDLPKGRTEIGNYNEHLIALAGDEPCPLNRAVVNLIRWMEEERIPPARERLAVLVDAARGDARVPVSPCTERITSDSPHANLSTSR